MEVLILCIPFWIVSFIILYFVYNHTEKVLQLTIFTGWIFLLGAPVWANILVGIHRPFRGMEFPLTLMFLISGFSFISNAKFHIWASEEHIYHDV